MRINSIPKELYSRWAGMVLLSGLLLTCISPVRAGRTLYVSKSGSDSSIDCSVGNPCMTITHAIQIADDGDRIEISAGTYEENLTIDKSVTLHGSGPAWTLVASDPNSAKSVFTILNKPGETTSVTLENMRIKSGISDSDGGGILTSADQLTVSNVLVDFNQAGVSGSGGGIACQAGLLVVQQSSIENNLASSGKGGGVWVSSGCSLTMSESAIILNNAARGGGLTVEGTAQLTNVTVSLNAANIPAGTLGGGGIEVGTGGILTLKHVTLARNRVEVTSNDAASQVWIQAGGMASFTNTIIGAFPGLNNALCGGVLTSGGYNLGEDSSCGLTAEGDLSDGDALLGGLAYNGSYTQTHALAANSPAIDAAAPPGPGSSLIDQRGLPVRDGDHDGVARRDIGAYEYQMMNLYLPAIIK